MRGMQWNGTNRDQTKGGDTMNTKVHAGYKAFNGHVFTEIEADIYNEALDWIEADKHDPALHESALNHAHLTFKQIIGAC